MIIVDDYEELIFLGKRVFLSKKSSFKLFRGIAASAPVFWFQNAYVPQDIFSKIVTRTFQLSGCKENSILASFNAILNLSKNGNFF